MKKHLALIILVLILSVLSVSFAYFGANIIKNGDNKTDINTGSLKLKISDDSVNIDDLLPVYDSNYRTSYKKEFTITNEENLNACSKIYLKLNSIDEELKSKYLKYILIKDNEEVYGDFNSTSDKLLLKGEYIESNDSNNYTLYIWISYDENENQINMLGKSLEASIYVEGFDASEITTCN